MKNKIKLLQNKNGFIGTFYILFKHGIACIGSVSFFIVFCFATRCIVLMQI